MAIENFGALLEREGEMKVLTDCLASALRGESRFVVVEGEAGAGKSRLVDEFGRQHGGDCLFLHGRGFATMRTTAYSIWVDALDFHLRSLSLREAQHVIGDHAELRRLFVTASERSGLAGMRDPGACDAEPTRLSAQLTAMVVRLSRLQPVVLVLDNLHWADSSSIEVLHAVVRGAQASRVMIVGIYRNDALADARHLASCVKSLRDVDAVSTISLHPLSMPSTSRIAAEVLGQGYPESIALEVHALAQGNPFFTRELLVRCAARAASGRTTLPGADEPMPPSIEAVIGERTRDLDDDARRVLAVSSVIEAHIRHDVLRDVTHLDEERLLCVLERLCQMGLLREASSVGTVRYAFPKPLVQATIYRGMSLARRRYLHGLVADVLVDRPDTDVLPSQVAMHVLNGTERDREAKALPYLLAAARDAIAVFGNHEAISLLGQALAAGEVCGMRDEDRVSLWLDLGECHKRLGRFEEALSAWRKALPLATPSIVAILQRSISRALWQSGREAEACRQLEDGIARLGPPTVEGAWLRQEFALTCVRQGRLHEAEALCESIRYEFDEAEHPELMARTLIVQSTAHGYRGELQRAMGGIQDAITLSKSLAYPGATFLACYTGAAMLRYDGDIELFESLCLQCDQIAGAMHALALESWSHSIRIERYMHAGRLSEALAVGNQALTIDEALDQGTTLPRTHAFLAVACRLSGDADGAARHMACAERLLSGRAGREARSAAVVATMGAYLGVLDVRYAEVQQRIESLWPCGAAQEPLRFYALHPFGMPIAAEAAARAGDASLASAWLDRFSAMQCPAFHPADGARHLVLGLLASLAGNLDAACRELHRATDIWSWQGRRFDAARILLDLSEAQRLLGDMPAAVRTLTDAAAEFRAMGARQEFARANQRLRKLGARSLAEKPARVLGNVISTRERQVAALIAAGKTNKEIAGTLFLSELTIETHVRNILRKLNFKSRVQIAGYAMSSECIPS